MPSTSLRIRNSSLTLKQKLFTLEYIVDFNGKQSAIRAGYSPKTADAAASRLLRNVKVSQAISINIKKRCERTKIDGDHVLQRLVEIDRMSVS